MLPIYLSSPITSPSQLTPPSKPSQHELK
jgi:hypothetical protein